jgi:high-affinity Fe2+/Pb2+ permease
VAAAVQTARRTPGFMMLLLLLAACGAQLVLFNLWFEFGERHREFVTPFLLLIISYGLSEARVKSRAEIFSSI